MMNRKLVETLEGKIAEAVALTLKKVGPARLPAAPSPQLIHLMAKAAVTVYEAAAHEVENQAALVDSSQEEEE